VRIDAPAAEPIVLAEAAHAMVESDARRAAVLAQRALDRARSVRDAEAEVAALHALGFARHELGDARSVRTLRAAVRIAERHGLHRRAALARRPLAVYLAYRGAIGAALAELDAACAVLDEHELARSEVFRIAVHHLAGRSRYSPESSEGAAETLRRAEDTIWEARLRKNRGFLLAERGDALAAEPDLILARDLYARAGATEGAIGADYELARIDLARGDLPRCLAHIDTIEAAGVSGLNAPALELLRAKALIAARLLDEARLALERASAVWASAMIDDPDGRLELISLTLQAGDPAAAEAEARRAQRSFAAQGRPVYAARATGLSLAAALARGSVRRSGLATARRAAGTLAAAGWRAEALRVRLSLARAALALGSTAAARRELAACRPHLRRAAVGDRIDAASVQARLAVRDGDPRGAVRAARRGLRLLGDYRAALGAAELRAGASQIGVELAGLGLGIALAGADRGAWLEWAERLRASNLRLSPVTPPDLPALRACTTELRQVGLELRRIDHGGRAARALLARQAELEASIRRLSRHGAGAGAGGSDLEPPRRDALAGALGRAALVEFVELEGAVSALVLVRGQMSLVALGPVAAVQAQLDWLRFGLSRLARVGGDAAQRSSWLAGAAASAEAIEAQLITPLALALGDRPLVVVPTGVLHALPWAMLPALRGRPVTVAPSAATWLELQAAPGRRRRGRVLLACGPRLRHARAEVAGIGAVYPHARSLTGRAATVRDVLAGLDGASIAHIVCHGHFRSDSPLFSSLDVADGGIVAYELERLSRPPDLIVLSACDLGVSGTQPGDELLGFAAALLGMGTRTVIASVVPVPDAAAKRLMVSLHRGLAGGASPGAALAAAQAGLRPRESALAGFVCLGAG
jgi:CHAT domain